MLHCRIILLVIDQLGPVRYSDFIYCLSNVVVRNERNCDSCCIM